MGETSFLVYLTSDDRIRHYHFSVRGKIIQFTVQYEAFILDNWHPVIRYDTAHGVAHLDRMHPDGTVEKVTLLCWDYNEALTFAQYDIRSNWEWYRQGYAKEMGK